MCYTVYFKENCNIYKIKQLKKIDILKLIISKCHKKFYLMIIIVYPKLQIIMNFTQARK